MDMGGKSDAFVCIPIILMLTASFSGGCMESEYDRRITEGIEIIQESENFTEEGFAAMVSGDYSKCNEMFHQAEEGYFQGNVLLFHARNAAETDAEYEDVSHLIEITTSMSLGWKKLAEYCEAMQNGDVTSAERAMNLAISHLRNADELIEKLGTD
jgi:hypothetical protein